MTEQNESGYDESQIVVSSVREAIIHRPGMFLAANKLDSQGLHYMICATLHDCVDPETLNAPSRLSVGLRSEGAVIIDDNGRGLPIKNLTATLRQRLQTGTLTQRYYSDYGYFWHATIFSALSKRLTVDTTFDGMRYTITASRGEIVWPLTPARQSTPKGTRLTFLPDAALWTDITFDADHIIAKLRELKRKYPHITYHFEDRRTPDGQRITF